MLAMWLAYDSEGNVIATLDSAVARDSEGNVVGLVDFAAHEASGGRMREIADVQSLDAPIPLGVLKQVLGRDSRPDEQVVLPADHPFRLAHDTVVGSGVWPEWLGARTYDFSVELDGKKLKALVHKKSGHRRERASIEAAISERINEKRLAARQAGEAIRADLKKRGMKKVMLDLVDDPDPEPADVRDLLGGPGRPLLLDEDGKTKARVKVVRANLPVMPRGA